MRRIASALGLGRDRRKLRSESTPALVHHADSSSSSGIRTPSDVDQDMLGVPAIHSGSSTDSVAHSVRSTRWLPASLLRSLSRKRPVSIPDPIVAVAEPAEDDASSDSLSTRSSRPRSPPALLPPPLPFATGRRSSSPASSIYRAGLANVQRRAPPSRANVALHAFTQPLVLAGVSPTPHPLRAPDPSSPLAFPRSVSRPHLAPPHSLRIQLHRARVLRRLEEGSLTAAEETSILPFATRSPRSPPLARRRPSPTEPEDAVADLGTRTGRWSRGLRRWVARSVFEDRMQVCLPTGSDIVRPARDLGTETLDFSDGTLALAGLAIDSETDDDEDYARSPIVPTTPPLGSPMDIKLASNGTAPERPSAGAKPSSSKTKAPVVRGVRFADDDDATDGDDLPLAVLASVQKKRAEKEARARHDRQVGAQDGRRNSVDAKARVFADQVARARVLRDSARAGVERPASFVREAEVRRKTLAPATGLSTLREDGSSHVREGRGHARTGSWGSTNDRRRNTVGEGSDPVPVRAGFSPSSSAFLAPSSPLANSAGLPSSAPSALASFPPNMSAPFMHSNSFPRAAHSPVRSQTTSPLRSSFALNTDEFGQPNLEAIMAQNQALLAQNQFLLQALTAPNPPFAHSQGGSSASSRRSGSSRPGPTPMQRSSVVTSGSQSPKVGSQPMKPSTSGQSQRTTGSSKPTPASSTPISHAHSKSVSQSHSKSKSQPNTRHAHSKSESQRMSRLMAAPAPPMPSVPTGVYSMRGRARTGAEVIT